MREATAFRMISNRINSSSTMDGKPPHRGSIMQEQPKLQDEAEIPMAYAESSTMFDGVYALPLASDPSHPSSLIRITKEQEMNLQAMGFPCGLSHELLTTVKKFPIRFWVVDNSGSMWSSDGHVLRGKGRNTQLVPCTRWAEMQATVNYHAELSGLLEATTIFKLLNPTGNPHIPQEVSIAEHGYDAIPQNIAAVKNVMISCQPQGPTPLAERLAEIREKVQEIAPNLIAKGQKAVVVIATDGLPTDAYSGSSPEAAREFVQVLRSLQSLPVWLVVRLCTDDDDTCNFYNSLDEELELPLEVLDDHVAEAQEVFKVNSWLNYGMPIHRTRELGYQHRIFDLLDERTLNKDEVKEFLEILFGREVFMNAPDVHKDWRGFLNGVTRVVKAQPLQWNPKTHKMEPWIDVKKLDRLLGEKTGLFAKMGSSIRKKGSRKSILK